jgi:glycosyltransferase involved in cell wall biosynthesis
VTLDVVGGVGSYVEMLLPGLVERFDVTVAAHGEGPIAEVARACGARSVPLKHVRRPISPVRDLLGLIELIRICRRVRPHVLHANSSKAGLLGRLAAWLARVPVRIFCAHGWAFATHPGKSAALYLWGDRFMRPLTTATICVAESERRRGVAARTCDADRTFVIHNGIDVAALPYSRHDAAVPNVISVGRLAAPKDFPTLVRALARVDEDLFRASIVGDGPDRDVVTTTIRETGLAERIDLLGERHDVAELLASSDLFALSSTSEAMPMSVLEAMAAGIPVIGAAVGGIPEVVEDGVTGILFAPGDVDALADALHRLLADAALRRQFGEAGRERARRVFDVSRFRSAHAALYMDQLESVNGAAASVP